MKPESLKTYSATTVPVANDGEAADGWQLIAPYCEAPMPDGRAGTQIFTRREAETLVANFRGKARKFLAKLFPVGAPDLPCYNGHPDSGEIDALSDDARDPEIYARVEDLDAREDGLWGKVRKAEPLFSRLKASAKRLEISPFWLCRREGMRLFPDRLISLGFVERGNLPGAAVINAAPKAEDTENFSKPEEKKMTEEQLKRIAELLGGDANDYADADKLIAAIEKTARRGQEDRAREREGEEARLERERRDREHEREGEEKRLREDRDFEARVAEEVEKRLKAQNAAAENRRLVDSAVADGRVPAANAEKWSRMLAADEANARELLASLPRHAALANASSQAERALAEDTAHRASTEHGLASAGNAFRARVDDLYDAKRRAGEKPDYDAIWNAFAQSAEGKALYEAAYPAA